MATYGDIVRRAYRKIGVSAEDEALTADQIATGMEELNSMLHSWKLVGVDLGHVDAAANDPFSLDPEFEHGTMHILASQLAPNYAVPPSFSTVRFFTAIQAAFFTEQTVTLPLELQMLGRRYASR